MYLIQKFIITLLNFISIDENIYICLQFELAILFYVKF